MRMERIGLFLAGVCTCGACLFMAACGEGEQTGQDTENIDASYMAHSMEDAPIVDYVVLRQLPGILIDRTGYSAGDVKLAVVKGSRLPETFSLMDAETEEVVYSGDIERQVYDESMEQYIGYADFSSVTKPGSYYLQCDIVGQSYRFEIQEQFYLKRFQRTYEDIMKDCESRSLSVSETMRLLEVYECYGTLFPDQDRSGTPDVLESMQRWVARMEEDEAWDGQEALYAALLAKLGYNYKSFDYQYATKCLKRAATVFGQMPSSADRDADKFFALTELYRAANLNTYRSGVGDYKSFVGQGEDYLNETWYLYGSMTYLMTRQKVDTDLCTVLMENIMSRGEEISKQYQDMFSLLRAEDDAPDALLKRAVELSCANYMLNNYQYTKKVKNFVHYLMGANLESVDFYESAEDKISYLQLLAQLAANEQNAKKQ